jgi:BED zinc finger
MSDYLELRCKRSAIWQHFTVIEGKANKAKCDTCGEQYSFTGGSTTNLATHLRKKHPSVAENLPRRKKNSAQIRSYRLE